MAHGDEHFEETVRTRTLKPPAVLYKYTNIDTARSVLSTGKLRFQSPLRYNDPLDSQWDVLWPTLTPEAIDYERNLLERAIRDPNSWPADADPEFKRVMGLERARIAALPEGKREEAIAEFVRDGSDRPSIPEPLSQRLLDIRRRMRVQCFSEDDRSVLMWSHYAAQHHGVVLGFDSTAMENGSRRPLEAIAYSDGPPVLIDRDSWIRSIIFGTPTTDLSGREREWALSKHTDWKYEREWRFVWTAQRGTLGDFQDFAFPREALVEFVEGCRTDAAAAVELLSLARAIRPDVRHYQMSVNPTRFGLLKTEVSTSTW